MKNMMKQMFRSNRRWQIALGLVVIAGLVLMSFGKAFAVAGQVDANNVTTAPTIDGNLNESGWNLANTANKTTIGTPNNTVTFGAMWNSTTLFVAVKVLDANLFNDSANTWEDDSVEVYIDANHNRGTVYDSFDRQFVKGYNDTGLSSIGSTTGVVHAWTAITGGYSVEMAIPWSNLGITPTAGMVIGFDVGYNDDDNAGTRDSQAVWWGTINNYNNTSGFGNLMLMGAGGVTNTPTRTFTPTNTAVGPTSTPTRTATPTNTPVGPTLTPTRTNTPGSSTNLAIGKAISASSSVFTFVAANANDNDVNTYWEGGGQPASLTVDLTANANITSLVIKLNPATAWGPRTQTFQVLSHNQSTGTFSNLVSSAAYNFDPATGNTVTIPVSATASAIQLNFTGNTGAPAGQVAELQIMGVMAPNPDLTITGITWSPASPSEVNAITVNATVQNLGSASSPASTVDFTVGGIVAGNAAVPALNAGASTVVSLNIGTRGQGSYSVAATVDPANSIVEQSNSNNSFTSPTQISVSQAPGPDLQITGVSMSPSSPTAGTAVSFIVSVNNRGTAGVAAGTITRVLIGSTTLNNTNSPAIAAGATVNVTVGTWTAVNGSTGMTATADATNIIAETNESNNAYSQPVGIGRGAIMPYSRIEAENAANTTNGTRLAPNFNLADYAGEASGRSAVLLDAQGEYVELTLPIAANAIVVRNAIPNTADGAGQDAPISIYMGGVDKGNLTVSSKYSYVYASPTTLGQLGYSNAVGGTAYWLYEEANMMLDQTYPAGTKIRIQKDAGDVSLIYVDFVEFENVAPAASNPDPTKYVQVSATKSIDQALTDFRADTTKLGIFIPAGSWPLSSKIFVYGRATQIIGAGVWWTKLVAPQDQNGTDMGFNIASTANGSVIKNLSAWGNYHNRIDGPGKFIDGNGMQNVTVDNIWIEHFVCLYWGVNSSNNTFKNLRIRNTMADGINMTNSSSNNIITNSEARGTGDDSFASFSAVDAGGSYNTGNQYTNLTAILVRRAAAFAIYGGSGNTFSSLYGADTLTYPGITINSYSFGYNTLGFGDLDTVFDGITLERVGGDFWTSNNSDDHINGYQNFAAIWFYAGDRTFKNIRVSNVDIINPVYFGVMFQSMYPQATPMTNIRMDHITISGAPRYGIKVLVSAEQGQGCAVGGVTMSFVTVSGSGVAPLYGATQCSSTFTITRGSGNVGW